MIIKLSVLDDTANAWIEKLPVFVGRDFSTARLENLIVFAIEKIVGNWSIESTPIHQSTNDQPPQ